MKTWLLEFEDDHSPPLREIGLDKGAKVIMKMPFGENYGYWTDNDLTAGGFERLFEVTYITKELFDEKWGGDDEIE